MSIPISFQDWERSLGLSNSEVNEQKVNNIDNADAVINNDEKVEHNHETVSNEAFDQIKKLCRICGSNGCINISTIVDPKLLSITPSVDVELWNIPIASMIEEISGESVSLKDILPQFVCIYCLGYLHHAYEIRLRIRSTSDNLREVHRIAGMESFTLESKQIDQSRLTKREIQDSKEVAEEEAHFSQLFNGSTNIKISTPKQSSQNLQEHKCPSCKIRIMTIASLKNHMEDCATHMLEVFFSHFYQLYNMKATCLISKTEYILRAIKLIFDVNQKLLKYCKSNKIDVKAISSHLPQTVPIITSVPPPQPQQINVEKPVKKYTFNPPQLVHKMPYCGRSPDNGYFSGPVVNSSHSYFNTKN